MTITTKKGPNFKEPVHPNVFLENAFGRLGAIEILNAVRQPNGIPDRRFFVSARLEDCVALMRDEIPLHRQSYYVLILLIKGFIVHANGTETSKSTGASLFVRSEGEFAQVIDLSSDISGYFCIFDRDFLESCFTDRLVLQSHPFFGYNRCVSVDLSRDDLFVLEHIFKMIHAEYLQDDEDKMTFLSSLFALFLIRAKRVFKSRSTAEHLKINPPQHSIVERFSVLLRRYAYSHRSVRFYSGEMAVSPGHLNKVLKQTTGKSAKDHILEAVVSEAKVLLKQTQLTVSEIAYKLSFEDVAHFVRVFKAITNLTPIAYRKTSREAH